VLNVVPVTGALLTASPFPCTRGLAHIVREQLIATDAKSKVAANFLTFRFIDVFLLVFGFPFRVMFVIRHQFPEIRDEVPENFSRGLNFLTTDYLPWP
jgi:hypothetical protein